MRKASKWLRNFLTGKKEKGKHRANQNSSNACAENPSNFPIWTTSPKEKSRWSFCIPSASWPLNSEEPDVTIKSTLPQTVASISDDQNMQKKDFTVITNGTAASIEDEDAAAIKIQSVFRSDLARRALYALRGIVKLQALVRGQLVRKQAMATVRCMEALLIAQDRARAQRIRMASEGKSNQSPTHLQTTHHNFLSHVYNEIERDLEENIKIVEMDVSESKGNFRFSSYHLSHGSHSQEENYEVSPSPSAESSPASKPDDTKLPHTPPRPACAESETSHDPSVPNYMANTESSRAKFRSHSAPKQRPDSFERQLSRRRASMEARNVPRSMRMRRSSSHVGATAQTYQYPWPIKLDRSTASLVDSECGSTSTVVTSTNTHYSRSLVAYDVNG